MGPLNADKPSRTSQLGQAEHWKSFNWNFLEFTRSFRIIGHNLSGFWPQPFEYLDTTFRIFGQVYHRIWTYFGLIYHIFYLFVDFIWTCISDFSISEVTKFPFGIGQFLLILTLGLRVNQLFWSTHRSASFFSAVSSGYIYSLNTRTSPVHSQWTSLKYQDKPNTESVDKPESQDKPSQWTSLKTRTSLKPGEAQCSGQAWKRGQAWTGRSPVQLTSLYFLFLIL